MSVPSARGVAAASHYGYAMLQYSRGGLASASTSRRIHGNLQEGANAQSGTGSRSLGQRQYHRRPALRHAAKISSSLAASYPAHTSKPTQQVRQLASISDNQPYEAVVVGAGPAGITCVGNLLERKLSPILWIDDGFEGGRVNRMYREVPSNTKVKTFIDYATGVTPFRRIISGQQFQGRWEEPEVATGRKDDKLSVMRALDQEKGCRLSHAADMCLMLTEGLRETAGVTAQTGKVAEATLDEASGHWNLRMEADSNTSGQTLPIHTKRLVLCTGSSPNNDPLPVEIPGIQNLDLDKALSPTRLSSFLSPKGPTTVSVIGASHSAVLVLMNLYALASTSKPDLRVRWLTRHPLRYAVFMDGWILRDNTGLKGEAADWAKANLEPENYKQSDVSKYIKRVDYPAGSEKDVYSKEMSDSDYYVQAIGYNRNPIPVIRTSSGKEVVPEFDHQKGAFNMPGLFGAGIAWPERVKDPHGNVEMAVGFFKFMKFVKRVSPEWN